MANKQYDMKMVLEAVLGSGFTSTFQKAQQSLSQAGAEVQRLNALQRDIAGYQAQQNAVEQTKRKLEDLQKQYDNIQREIQETGTYSSALENKLIDKQRQIDKTTESLDKQTDKLDAMESELQEAGVDTENLTEEQQKLEDAVKEASEEEENFGEQGVQAIEAVATALVTAGIAKLIKEIGEAYKECVTLSADFQATMSTVEALSGANSEEMEALTQKAKDLGATTAFTAIEVAEGMTYMGMAGWDAQQMMEGLPGVLNLAAASGEDLAIISDIVTDALTAFGLTAEDTGHFADVLAKAATSSNTSVAGMGETFKTAAPLAGALGYSVEDVAVAIGLMANAGIKGSNAGTALRNMFTHLIDSVTLTSENFGEINYSAQNADGTMRSWGQTLQDLRGYFAQMTDAEQVQNANLLVGTRAMTGFVDLMKSSDTDFNAMTAAIYDCAGAAEEMANIKLDNLDGQITILKSAWDGLRTTFGEAFQSELQKLAEKATGMLTVINDFLAKHPGIVKAITVTTGLLAGLLAGVVAFVGVMTGLRAIMTAVNTLTALSTKLKAAHAAAAVKEAAATQGAAAAQNTLNASLLANPYVAAAAGIAALTAALVLMAKLTGDANKETEGLTVASKEQYAVLQNLKAEYAETVDLYGENSAEAQALSTEIDTLTASYENNKQTIEELKAEYDAFFESVNKTLDSNREAVESIQTDAESTQIMTERLASLADQTDRTTAAQVEMNALIEALNSSVPGLGLKYDDLANGMGNYAEKIEALASSQAKAQLTAAAQKGAVDATVQRQLAETKLAAATAQQTAAQEKLNEATAAYTSIGQSAGPLGWLLAHFSQANQDMHDAQAELDATTEAVTDAEAAVAQANADYEMYVGLLEDSATSTAKMYAEAQTADDVITAMSASVADLSAEYTACYTAAKESFEGQFGLFDTAQASLEATVANAQAALDTQLQYWQNYGANLDVLRSTSASDLGITQENYSALLTYVQSGSEEAAGLAASMVEAINSGNTEAVATLADTVAQVQAAQDAAAQSVAAMQTDLDGKMAEIVNMAKETVANLDLTADAQTAAETMISAYSEMILSGGAEAITNAETVASDLVEAADASAAAASAAEAIMSSYASAISSSGQTAVTAAQSIADQVAAALASAATSVASLNALNTTTTTNGYATGTEYATPGLHLVGEDGPELIAFQGGERVYNNDETQKILAAGAKAMEKAAELNAGLVAYSGTDILQQDARSDMLSVSSPTGARMSGGEPGGIYAPIRLEIHIDGNATQSTVDGLRDAGNEIVSRVLEALEDREYDRIRRAYT